jgi:6-pyruvoyltetrahydropterin/6-carboxytetrahydropterin synthase
MQRLAQISVRFGFESSHLLWRPDWTTEQNESVFGNCTRLHGHSYRLIVTLRGPIDPSTGMVLNFRDLKRVVRARVLDRLDHRHLNDLIADVSTAENICCWIARELLPAFGGTLHRLELWETEDACAVLDRSELAELGGESAGALELSHAAE